jgi:hypothetical protein
VPLKVKKEGQALVTGMWQSKKEETFNALEEPKPLFLAVETGEGGHKPRNACTLFKLGEALH